MREAFLEVRALDREARVEAIDQHRRHVLVHAQSFHEVRDDPAGFLGLPRLGFLLGLRFRFATRLRFRLRLPFAGLGITACERFELPVARQPASLGAKATG